MSDTDEYLRRNLLVAKAVGAHAAASKARARLADTKRAPKWLLDCLSGIIARTRELPKDLARYRDESK